MQRKTTFHQVLATALLLIGVAFGQNAFAESSWTIGSSYNPSTHKTKFTIKRSEYTYPQTVLYRTVGLSAYPGQHYTAVSGELNFTANDSIKEIEVTELNPSDDAYKFQNGSTRTYLFEVTDKGGFLLATKQRDMTTGTSVNNSSTTVFGEKELTIKSEQFTVTDAGYDQAYHSVNVNNYYSASASKNYFTTAGAQLRMTVTFDAREKDDGYQYIAIYANTNTGNVDTGAKDGNPGTIYYSRYMAGFTIEGNVNTTFYPYTFPVTSQGNNCGYVEHPWSGNPKGNLEQQYFNTNCRATDGRLIIPTDLSSLYVRFDASGNLDDDWYAKNVKAHIQAVDNTAPTMKGIVANPGRHAKGNTVYVSVAFSEIMKVTGTPTLSVYWGTTSGTLDYTSGSGSNVLTFKGIIPKTVSGKVSITGYDGTIQDLAGNDFSGSISYTDLFSTNADLAYALSDFRQDDNHNYLITCHDDLRGLAGLVNNGGDISGKTFLQVTNLTFPYSTQWNNSSGTENNFTCIGNSDHLFQGTYDGEGHTISGIRIYRDGEGAPNNYQGLFGKVSGTVKRVHLTDTRITGKSYVGGIAGETNSATIEECTVANNVCIHAVRNSSVSHGGVVGLNRGTVQSCISHATLSIVNTNYGSAYGGIVGRCYSGSITDCLAIGVTIPGVDNRGAILGLRSDGSLTCNYYLNCTVAGTANATNVGFNGTDYYNGNSARALYALTLGQHIAIDHDPSATLPGSGNITYDNGANINGQPYSYATATLNLTYNSNPPTGYHVRFTANAGSINGNTLTMPASAVTVSTDFVANTYSVRFNKNNTNATGTMANQGFTYGVTQPLNANNYSRTGYTFAGWNTQADGNGTFYTDQQSVSNLTPDNNAILNLYAQWTPNQYTVTLDQQIGSGGTTSVTATFDAAMPDITIPTITGYTFGGYYTETNGGGTQYYNADGTSAHNWDITEATTLYAQWSIIDWTGTGEANNPYMISTTAQFDLVATLVNNGESYSGVYFKLADNANITVSNMIGTSEHPFSGNFDGNRSHNATLTLDLLFDTKVIYTAPFRYVSGANIHDLFVGGNMRIGNDSQYAASIVAHSEGTTILNNCVSNVEINSEAQYIFAYNGGLVGHVASGSTLNITNCVFKGSVFYHNSGQCCGFVGLNHGTTNINGGIYEPSYQQLYSYYDYYNFINPDMGTYSLTDCYYTQPMGESWQGTIAYTSVRDNLCHQISIAGETVYASPDDTFIDNVNGVYDYTGAVININPTVIFGGETLDPSCYTLSLTYNGNPATEVNARGNYLYTAAGVNANGYYGNVYRYFSVVGFDGSGTDSDPYLIESIEDWNKLASRVYDGTTYSGKHFKLMANLTISKVVGYNKINSFQGIFDGNGHTLTLNGDDFGTSGYYTSFNVCAPFRYVAGTTIKNLKVAGDIYTRTQFAGGLIGRAGDGNNVIQNCIVSVNIHSSISGDGTHGGFIAHLQGGNGALSETTFTGCAFTGSITTTNNTTNVGGFVGWCDWGNGPDNGHCCLFFNDCFINPSASCISSGSKTFARCNDESQSLHFNNGYFTQAIGDSQGKRVENDGALPIGSYTLYNVSGLKFYDNGLKDSDGTFYHYINAPSNYINRQFIGYGDNNDHWAFIASPLEDNISPNDVNNLLDNNEAYYDLYRLNPSNTRWENWKAHEGNAASNFNFVNGMGYLYATKYNRIVTFTGTLNMGGEKTISGLPNGYNLVGNPFCIEAYVNKPYYTLDDNGAIIVANPVDKATPIQPCYGVIVKVENNEDIVFRTTEPFTNSNNGSLEMTLAQTVATRDGYALKTLDNAIISFDEGSKLTKFYFGHQDANIYIPVGHEEYAIAYSEGQGEMPLNFKAVTNGSYTLTVNPEGLEMNYLHLIDNLTGANIDLLQTPTYTFSARNDDYESRFRLIFSANNDNETEDGFAFISNGQLIITSEGRLQIIDMMGRVISTEVVNGTCSKAINLKVGLYVLQLINGENVKTQKIVIK
ncbi:MAG: InlB B-repeat-containing protein [Bacteroidales bacterium]|nr:InlB B-repeat-containing protein [Bacteroidales bacterium]